MLKRGTHRSRIDKERGPSRVALKDGPSESGQDGRLNEKAIDFLVNVFLSLLEQNAPSGLTANALLDLLERNIIIKVLWEFNGHQARAAEFLHLKPTTLHEKIKRYELGAKITKATHLRRFMPVEYFLEKGTKPRPDIGRSFSS